MNKELGCAGHFIGAQNCHFRRHTQVGDSYRVSTVGDYYPREQRETLGAAPDSFFETFVFRTLPKAASDNDGCGCHAIEEWCEIDAERYATAGAALAGHNKFVEKYTALDRQYAETQQKE